MLFGPKRIGIISSRATSLREVARDIAHVAKRMKVTPVLLDYTADAHSLKRMIDRAIVVMAFNPLIVPPYALLVRDLNRIGVKSVLYTTVEGDIPRHLLYDWIRRDVPTVANSNYTRRKLEAVGVKVLATIPHGVNFDVVDAAKPLVDAMRRVLQQRLGDGVYFVTVASSHPRKGMDRYAVVVRKARQQCKECKFYIVTEAAAAAHFAGIDGVYVDTNFGKRSKTEVFALLGAADWYVQPSLAEGFCLPPGTPVITINGIKPIEEVKEGDLVLTHEGRFRKVIRTTKRHHKGKIVKLIVWNNRAFELKLTPEHPVLAVRRPKKKWRKSMGRLLTEGEVNIEWISASELRKGDIVLFPIPKQIFKVDVIDLHEVLASEGIEHEYDDNSVWLKYGFTPNVDVSYSKIAEAAGININVVKYVFEELLPKGKKPRTDEHRKVIEVATKLGYVRPEPKKYPRYISDIKKLARLLGYYTAEGSIIASGNAVELSFGGDETDLVEDVVKIVEELFGDEARVYKPKDRNVVKVVLCGVPYVALVKQCGVGARNKRIPAWILYGDIDVLREFIDAYIKGDGSIIKIVNKNKVSTRITATTVSLQLAVDLKIAFVRLGYKSSVKAVRRKDGRVEYIVDAIAENRGVVHSNKSWFIANKYIGFLVANVVFEEYDGIVYNLEVEEDNSYTTLVCSVHNCLPPLEAMAMGTPVVHIAYDPINEFTEPKANILVPYSDVRYESFEEGLMYELHIYDPDELVVAILEAADIAMKRREEYEERSARVAERAKQFDAVRLYQELIKIVK